MSTTQTMDDNQILPGAQLAAVRLQKGYTKEYVAGKLHLRVDVIELIECDDYPNLPEAVFIKGYLRAYAKLLDIAHEPLLSQFNKLFSVERKFERALWQNRRETNKAEHAVRWLTSVFALVVIVSVAMWWHTNKENEPMFHAEVTRPATTVHAEADTEIKLTDLSKMRSLLSSNGEPLSAETQGE